MATNVLPTYQKYVNGVPVPARRQASLRIREKYIICLVFVTFLLVCFGGFFFLPDLSGRIEPLDIFIPQHTGQHVNHHQENVVEAVHMLHDREKINRNVDAQKDELGPGEYEDMRLAIEKEKEAMLNEEKLAQDNVCLISFQSPE